MFCRLRNILLVSSAAWLMMSCQSDADEPETESNEMFFTTEVTSRAALVSNSNIINTPFIVFGDMISIDRRPDSKLIPTYNGAEVRFDSSLGKWICNESRYWFSDYQHSFVAVQPSKSDNLSNFQFSDNQLNFIYSQPADYKAADDLLIATLRRNYSKMQESNAAPLKFGHALTNLNIVITYTDPTLSMTSPLTVRSLSFKNIPKTATYAVSPAPLSGNSMTNDCIYYDDDVPGAMSDGWTVIKRADLEINFSAEGNDARIIPNDNKGHYLFTSDDPLLLIPNPATPTEMVISYSIYEDFGREHNDKTTTLIIPKGWNAGLNYILSITITNESVLFNIDVADWKEGTSTDTTVPR